LAFLILVGRALIFCIKKAALYEESSKSFQHYCAYFLTTTTLDKIWLNGLVLYLKQEILKINFASHEIQNRYFCEDDNCTSSFMVDLVMGYYVEHVTMVGDRFVKIDFSD